MAARNDAAMALLEAGPRARQAWPALVAALTDDERLDCEVAACALYTGAPAKNEVSALVHALKFDTEARTPAAWELSRLGPAAVAAAPALIKALASEDKHARNFAVIALAQVGSPPEAVPALVKVIKDAGSPKSPQMNYRYPRAAAAIALGLMGPAAKEAVPALADMLGNKAASPGGKQDATSWEYHRAAAAFALGEIGPDARQAAPAVTRALKDPSPVVRRWAVRALGAIAPQSGATSKALKEALVDTDRDVRRAAELALKTVSTPRNNSVAALVKALSSDAGRATRESVRDGLRALAGSEAAWKPVAKGARKQALPVHESIAVALGYVDSLSTAPTPGEIERQQGQLSEDVVRYLLAIGGIQQGVARTLLEALGDEKRAARRSAVAALGGIGKAGGEAVAALEKALTDEDWMVRNAAAEALHRIDRMQFPL